MRARHALTLVLAAHAALGAPQARPPAEAPPTAEERAKAAQDALAQLPAPVRLGLRVEAARRALPVAPVLVIADGAEAYLQALALWTPQLRFPVLIDDATPRAAEDIARFARTFRPEQTLLLSAPRPDQPEPLGPRVDQLLAAAWGAESREQLAERWKTMGFAPPGMVVLSPNDPAWAGGAALALGRGEVTMWIDDAFTPGVDPGTMWEDARFAPFAARIQAGLDASGYAWRELGDDIDSVTLALNVPAKINRNSVLAMTDAIGRHDTPPRPPDAPNPLKLPDTSGVAGGRRFAWCGQVLGTEASSAYMAMCALFVQPRSAWLFDGYRDGAPFGDYDVAGAAEQFSKAGLRVTTDNRPEPSPEQWRMRAMRPVDAGIVHVNSAGYPRWFELPPGGMGINRAATGDVPALLVPAMVHFIHSFSAENVADRSTIAARWLEQGAYCYAGSVSEPYLTAFQTPERLAGRMLAPSPWGAAVRQDSAMLWKIAVFGDPLATLGATVGFAGSAPGGPPPVAAIPTIEGARPASGALAEALRGRRFAEAARLQVMLGRDPDLLKIVEALVASDPGAITPELARVTLPAMHRVGRADLALRAFMKLPPEQQADPIVLDTLWQAARAELATTRSGMYVETLRSRMREGSIAADASALARCASRLSGIGGAEAIISEAMARTTDEWEQRRLRDELERLKAGGR